MVWSPARRWSPCMAGRSCSDPASWPCVNALLLGSLMYRSGLVPRIIPLVGLIGAPILFASDIAIMFGLWEQFSLPANLAVIPIFVWELSLGIYLVVKGFKPSPITAGMTAASTMRNAA